MSNLNSTSFFTPARINQGAGGLVLGAGLLGYWRQRSSAQKNPYGLIAGLTLGGLFLSSSYLLSMAADKRQQQQLAESLRLEQQGHLLASGTGAVGFATMAHWLVQSGRIMPSGAIAIVCSLALGYNNFKAIHTESDNAQSPVIATNAAGNHSEANLR